MPLILDIFSLFFSLQYDNTPYNYKGKYFAVYAHKKAVHFVGERKKFFCDLCDHSTLSKARLKTHRERKHIGITYPCDQGGKFIKFYNFITNK